MGSEVLRSPTFFKKNNKKYLQWYSPPSSSTTLQKYLWNHQRDDAFLLARAPPIRHGQKHQKKKRSFFSGDSWMYPYQRTPMGNPYMSSILRGYLWVIIPNPQRTPAKYHGYTGAPKPPNCPLTLLLSDDPWQGQLLTYGPGNWQRKTWTPTWMSRPRWCFTPNKNNIYIYICICIYIYMWLSYHPTYLYIYISGWVITRSQPFILKLNYTF